MNHKFVKELKSTFICKTCGMTVVASTSKVLLTRGICQQSMSLAEHIDQEEIGTPLPEPEAQHA